MKSFRTEHENLLVEEDILELERKIYAFQHGEVDEEKFRSLRLARGVYGQRQPGVQMIRIKLPYGRVTSAQLLGICDVADRYSTGKLHITTRQDIQVHHVSQHGSRQVGKSTKTEALQGKEEIEGGNVTVVEHKGGNRYDADKNHGTSQ